MLLKLKLLGFKIKYFFCIFESKILNRKIKNKFLKKKKEFQNHIEKKHFSRKWFLNNFDVFHYFLSNRIESQFSYLEVGSYEGLSALNILYHYKNSKVVTIDLWSEPNENSEALDVEFSNIENNFDKNLDGYNVLKIKGDSVSSLRSLLRKKKKFDVIYIDGSHNGEDVLSDAIESYKLLNLNGLIFFDDLMNINYNINIQSFEGFDLFLNLFKKKIKILFLSRIAVIKKVSY